MPFTKISLWELKLTLSFCPSSHAQLSVKAHLGDNFQLRGPVWFFCLYLFIAFRCVTPICGSSQPWEGTYSLSADRTVCNIAYLFIRALF